MLPYHPQTNRQVDQAHQTLMQMIEKLGKDQKADWPKHLLELVHAHNSHKISHHGVQPTLSNVWVITMPTH